jgi:hypothetical protein
MGAMTLALTAVQPATDFCRQQTGAVSARRGGSERGGRTESGEDHG